MSDDGLVTIASPYTVQETLDRLATGLAARGMTLFARIDHAAGAAAIGMSLRPTELVIFGNPRGGTPLMQSRQTSGIDLPLKMLGWQDEGGQTRLSWNDPNWIAQRHGIDAASGPAVAALAVGLASLAEAAVA